MFAEILMRIGVICSALAALGAAPADAAGRTALPSPMPTASRARASRG
jgi:hypothetical protein